MLQWFNLPLHLSSAYQAPFSKTADSDMYNTWNSSNQSHRHCYYYLYLSLSRQVFPDSPSSYLDKYWDNFFGCGGLFSRHATKNEWSTQTLREQRSDGVDGLFSDVPFIFNFSGNSSLIAHRNSQWWLKLLQTLPEHSLNGVAN